jgi:hypothetical protein
MTAAIVMLAISLPVLPVIGLFMLAAWRDRRRETVVAHQVRLTDAIAAELGLVVAPVVARPLGGPWRVEIRLPVGPPERVSRIVTIALDTLTRAGADPYELVLTPAPAGVRTVRRATRAARRPGRPCHGEGPACPRSPAGRDRAPAQATAWTSRPVVDWAAARSAATRSRSSSVVPSGARARRDVSRRSGGARCPTLGSGRPSGGPPS